MYVYYGFKSKGMYGSGTEPVISKVYLFFDKDVSHGITLSYREAEESFWKADLEKVMKTFEFVRR